MPRRKKRPPLRVGGYCRVSTAEQAYKVDASPENQRDKIKRWCEREHDERGHDTQLVLYEDLGRSGQSEEHRPEYLKLLAAIEDGQLDVVIVNSLSRLCRSLRDFLKFAELCNQNNVKFVALKQGFDMTTLHGEFNARLIMMLAEFEAKLTSQRTQEVVRARRHKGRFCGGYPPLGLTTKPNASDSEADAGVLVKDGKNFRIVNEVFRAFEKAGSLRGAVKVLKSRGVRRPAWTARKSKKKHPARDFTVETVERVLTDVSYIGKVRIPKWWISDDLTESDHESTPQFIEVKAKWRPFIDVKRFKKVQRTLGQNRLSRGNVSKGTHRDYAKYPLSGIAECGYSGLPLTGHTAKAMYRYYFVAPSKGKKKPKRKVKMIRAEELEGLVIDRIRRLADDADLLTKAEEAARKDRGKRLATKKSEVRALEKELNEVRDEMRSVVDGFQTLHTNKGSKSRLARDLQNRYGELEKRERDLEKSVKSRRAETPLTAPQRRRLSLRLKRLTKLLEELDKGSQARLFGLFISKLVVSDDRILLGLRNAPLETWLREEMGKRSKKDEDDGPEDRIFCVRTWLPG